MITRSAIVGLCLIASHAVAQVTMFNYQGRLCANSIPMTGPCDLRFSVYDAPGTNGNIVGGPLLFNSVPVTNGTFNVSMDFGAAAFNGQARWLAIEVRAMESTNDFQMLSPFQNFLAVPYAVSAARVSGPVDAGQLTGTLPASVFAGVNGGGLMNLNLSQASPNYPLPDSVLSGNVVLRNTPFHFDVTGAPCWIISSNDTAHGDGSTFNLGHYGSSGYCDINFFTAPNRNQMFSSPHLNFAIGASPVGATNDFSYQYGYLELYDGNPFYVVRYHDIRGGFRGDGSFTWYQDGTTNTPMFTIDRHAKSIINNYPAFFASSVTAGPAAQFNGSGAGLTDLNASAIVGGITTNLAFGTNTLQIVNGIIIGVH
ncbi:MAG: hypothetical protein JWQ04_2830 [Pedosphaera sp.]|nr:hypothetical protein [Pedosphaera sp.]